jgi:hypothetical protein
MRAKIARAPDRLECGCFRYCDSCTDNTPSDTDLEFSRSIAESFGEAWFDSGQWNATDFSRVRIPSQPTEEKKQ